MLRQDRQLPYDVRQLAVTRPIKGEGDLTLSGQLDLCDMAIVGAVKRAIRFKNIKGEYDVVRRHRLVVMPSRIGSQAIRHCRVIGGMADGFCKQSVCRRYTRQVPAS